jgi:quinol monooxygenase YgiN
MTAFNVVRFRVKPGRDEEFIKAHREMTAAWPGAVRFSLVKTGEHTYCIVGEWNNFANIVAARPMMLATLDRIRDTLEDMGMGLGLTDPVSGQVVVEKKTRGAKKRKASAKKPPKKKTAKKKRRK